MKYEKPELEIVRFTEFDVIRTSTLTDTGTGGSGGQDDDDVIEF